MGSSLSRHGARVRTKTQKKEPKKKKKNTKGKLIKLNTIDHVYNIPQQKPIDQLWKKMLNSSTQKKTKIL